MNYVEARAQSLYRDGGVGLLCLSAQCDRANAEQRYWNGDIDFALTHLKRAEAAERLAEQLEQDDE